jgi:NTE family protein
MLRDLIKELIPHNSFEGLERQLQVCVVNLNTAHWQLISSGNELDKWVAASASIPGLFETILADKEYFVDGGLLNNMPAQAIRNSCRSIIGVDVIPHTTPSTLAKPIDTLAFSVRAMQHQNSRVGRGMCDFLIEPRAVDEFHEFSFEAYQSIYQSGYDAAKLYIAEHPAMLKLAEK